MDVGPVRGSNCRGEMIEVVESAGSRKAGRVWGNKQAGPNQGVEAQMPNDIRI